MVATPSPPPLAFFARRQSAATTTGFQRYGFACPSGAHGPAACVCRRPQIAAARADGSSEVRAAAQAAGRRFDSGSSHHWIAQLGEHRSWEPRVAGSSPAPTMACHAMTSGTRVPIPEPPHVRGRRIGSTAPVQGKRTTGSPVESVPGRCGSAGPPPLQGCGNGASDTPRNGCAGAPR